MKRSRFTEDQIIGMLKEHEAGVPVADLCRKHGVSTASLYKCKGEYADSFNPRRDLTLRPMASSAPALVAHPGQSGQTNRQSLHHAG